MPNGPFTRWSLIAATAALVATGSAWSAAGGRIFAPAALSSATGPVLGGVRSHAELSGACGACHVAPWSAGGMDQQCLACHTDIRAELADTTRLHGSLADASACRSCHTEHHGADATLTRMDAAALDHAAFGFSLATHTRTADARAFACRDCHGGESYRFSAADCEGCHREYQPSFVAEHSAMWGPDCRACHDGSGADGAGFDHAGTRFPLAGAHVRVACRGCHEGARTAAQLAATATECIACHRADDEHRGAMGPDCAACHGDATWEGAVFDHAFPLDHGSREPVECSVCHQDAPDAYERYTCYGCHEHTPAGILAEHRGEGISERELPECVRCHAGGEHDGERGGERGRRDGDSDG